MCDFPLCHRRFASNDCAVGLHPVMFVHCLEVFLLKVVVLFLPIPSSSVLQSKKEPLEVTVTSLKWLFISWLRFSDLFTDRSFYEWVVLITYRPRKILLHLCQPVVDYMHSMYSYSGFHRGIQSLEMKLPLFSLSFERQAATLGEVGCSPWPRERAV